MLKSIGQAFQSVGTWLASDKPKGKLSSNETSSTGSGYDVVNSKNKRRAGNGVLRSEDQELNIADRRKMLTSAKMMYRNFALIRWMVARHLDYVSTFTFQARTKNPDLNKHLEKLMKGWSKRSNFEASGRFSRTRFTRMAEMQRVINGDIGVVRLRSGKVQGIEGDRIRTPQGGLPAGYTPQDLIHGVRTHKSGRHLEYCVCQRGKFSDAGGGSSLMTFERMVPARNMTLFGYQDWMDQTRGISPLACSLKDAIDCYEASEYALAKMKIDQLIGLVFKREALGEGSILDKIDGENEESEDAEEGVEEPRYGALNLGNGPIQLDLDPGDDFKIESAQTPSTQFQQYFQTTVQVCLKSLDIPYSFYSENFSNYSGSRQALLQYNQAATVKRQDLQELLDELTLWRCLLWMQDGQLQGVAPDDLVWEWVPSGLPWIDPLKEVQAQLAALGAKITSRQRILREAGMGDFDSIVSELAYENRLLTDNGMSAEVIPGQIAVDDESPQPTHGQQ